MGVDMKPEYTVSKTNTYFVHCPSIVNQICQSKRNNTKELNRLRSSSDFHPCLTKPMKASHC